jgi:hypothetical protein
MVFLIVALQRHYERGLEATYDGGYAPIRLNVQL